MKCKFLSQELRGLLNSAVWRFGSMKALADRLNVSRWTVTRWLTGESIPNVAGRAKIAHVLDSEKSREAGNGEKK